MKYKKKQDGGHFPIWPPVTFQIIIYLRISLHNIGLRFWCLTSKLNTQPRYNHLQTFAGMCQRQSAYISASTFEHFGRKTAPYTPTQLLVIAMQLKSQSHSKFDMHAVTQANVSWSLHR